MPWAPLCRSEHGGLGAIRRVNHRLGPAQCPCRVGLDLDRPPRHAYPWSKPDFTAAWRSALPSGSVRGIGGVLKRVPVTPLRVDFENHPALFSACPREVPVPYTAGIPLLSEPRFPRTRDCASSSGFLIWKTRPGDHMHQSQGPTITSPPVPLDPDADRLPGWVCARVYRMTHRLGSTGSNTQCSWNQSLTGT